MRRCVICQNVNYLPDSINIILYSTHLYTIKNVLYKNNIYSNCVLQCCIKYQNVPNVNAFHLINIIKYAFMCNYEKLCKIMQNNILNIISPCCTTSLRFIWTNVKKPKVLSHSNNTVLHSCESLSPLVHYDTYYIYSTGVQNLEF